VKIKGRAKNENILKGDSDDLRRMGIIKKELHIL